MVRKVDSALRQPRLRGADPVDLSEENFKARVSRISVLIFLASSIVQSSTECLLPRESSLSSVDTRLHIDIHT